MASPTAQPGPIAPQAPLPPPPPPPAAAQPGPIAPQEPPPPPPPALSDDILREIFIRLPCPADLARAAISCASFRCVITEPSFIRRFRALNPQPLLGVLDHNGDFFPAEPPHPSAPAARTVARGIDFSCTFLPTPHLWRRRDVRDGRFLLSRFEQSPGNSVFMELAVCDPLSRRYVLLPPVPDDLATSAQMQNLVDLRPFFAPAGDDEADTSFRVIYMVRCVAKLAVFTFSSDAEQWNVLAYHGWAGLVAGTPTWSTALSERHYVHGCICWFLRWNQKLLLLDTHRMEFSIINLPSSDLAEMEQIAIVEQPEGRLGLFIFMDELLNRKFDICYMVWQNNAEGLNQWSLERLMRLPSNYRYNYVGSTGGYLLVQGVPEVTPATDHAYFSVDLKTFKVERFCETKHPLIGTNLFAGFPPSLTPPSI
ncbi:hypothetical protein ABZP36_001170 [Zizania latifolia]